MKINASTTLLLRNIRKGLKMKKRQRLKNEKAEKIKKAKYLKDHIPNIELMDIPDNPVIQLSDRPFGTFVFERYLVKEEK